MQRIEAQLIARLRVGSVLTTRKGASYRVIEPVMQVAPNGRVVPSLVVERTTTGGRTPRSVLISIGILTNLMRHGARHKPGRGAPDRLAPSAASDHNEGNHSSGTEARRRVGASALRADALRLLALIPRLRSAALVSTSRTTR